MRATSQSSFAQSSSITAACLLRLSSWREPTSMAIFAPSIGVSHSSPMSLNTSMSESM